MDKNVMELWTDALRSGKYKQGEGCLRNYDNEFCCLGVLADILGKPTRTPNDDPLLVPCQISLVYEDYDDYDSWPLSNNGVELTYEESKKLQDRMNSTNRTISRSTSLMQLNDKGFSFKEIADIIERNADTL